MSHLTSLRSKQMAHATDLASSWRCDGKPLSLMCQCAALHACKLALKQRPCRTVHAELVGGSKCHIAAEAMAAMQCSRGQHCLACRAPAQQASPPHQLLCAERVLAGVPPACWRPRLSPLTRTPHLAPAPPLCPPCSPCSAARAGGRPGPAPACPARSPGAPPRPRPRRPAGRPAAPLPQTRPPAEA